MWHRSGTLARKQDACSDCIASEQKSLVDLLVLVAVGKSIVPLCTSGCYIHRVGLAVDMRSVLPVKINIAFDPGAKMMRV